MATRFTGGASYTFSKKDRSYAHRRPYLRSSDVPDAPYMGDPEDRLTSAFMDSYGLAAVQMRTPAFAEMLGDAMAADAGREMLERFLGDAGTRFHAALARDLVPVVNAGAAAGRLQVRAGFQKAGALAVNHLPQRGMNPGDPVFGRRPKPLPPYRRLLRIPARRINIQPATQGRVGGQVAQTYLDAVNALALDLVGYIDDTQKAGILEVLDDGMRKGDDADILSMRIANLVGLDPRWQRAVQNFENGLLNAATPLPSALIQRRVQDYSDWLRERRGIRIARTELMRGMNTGRLLGWHDQAASGEFDAATSIKVWSAAPDACPVCRAEDGNKVVGIDTPFTLSSGAKVVMPPAHPHCRCTAVIRPRYTGSPPDVEQRERDLDALYDPEMQRLLASQPQAT
jgi:hypothetical protein